MGAAEWGSPMFRRLESVMATVAALLLFTLNELRMYHERPRALDTAHGYVHGAYLRLFGGSEQVFLTSADLVVRWSLVALVLALSAWALADSLDRKTPVRRRVK